MFVFGCAITDQDVYRACARPGIERAAEPDSRLVERPGPGSLQRKYNSILGEAVDLHGLEGVILVHEDTEILETGLIEKLRARLADPAVGIVGAIGARGVRNINWWDSDQRFGKVATPGFPGGGAFYTEMPEGTHAVEAVDGFFLAFSPWATRNLRFDLAFEPLHGYDVDISFQARSRGKLVLVEGDLWLAHHRSPPVFPNRHGWVQAHLTWHRKWSPDRVRSPFDR